MSVNWDLIKEKLGQEAVQKFIPQKGLIGLGSGSTSACFIKELASREQKNASQSLHCIATSSASHTLAESLGLPLVSSHETWEEPVDITCDGADYIDIETGTAIKGFGGALLREKIIAQSSNRLVLMVDERKVIPHNTPIQVTIPVEITRFGAYRTKLRIQELLSSWYSVHTSFRRNKENSSYFESDNGNYTIDITLDIDSSELQMLNTRLHTIAGVVETGIFVSLATDILIGLDNGDIQHRIIPRKS